jgi:hypothetical protein
MGKRIPAKATYSKIVLKHFHSLFIPWSPRCRGDSVSVHRSLNYLWSDAVHKMKPRHILGGYGPLTKQPAREKRSLQV